MTKTTFSWPTCVKTLSIEDKGDGCFVFSADEGSEAGRWLQYYDESDERREVFRQGVIDSILSFIEQENKTWPLDATIHYFQEALRLCPTNDTTRQAYRSALKHLRSLL